ncbi:hypothetical protein M0F12_23460 [Ralstonia solanacearum]|uniref:hypothetical protein n=1 Tax=Ralstonia solanacearum TaxID=305 RepID=UPI0012D406A1|nr:hypothetical protein [Ralstonia solanacearum]MCL9851676.1 hypothetical protein [Ralstonia solanacearum]MCL9861565.1 hypothetical protein [Ralstonia solanacearum]MCL9866469.1 hypothetical protein [Ralstonia solanacearum]MCL9871230.1 hypothetical protein [Ralstonia solanacearum]
MEAVIADLARQCEPDVRGSLNSRSSPTLASGTMTCSCAAFHTAWSITLSHSSGVRASRGGSMLAGGGCGAWAAATRSKRVLFSAAE